MLSTIIAVVTETGVTTELHDVNRKYTTPAIGDWVRYCCGTIKWARTCNTHIITIYNSKCDCFSLKSGGRDSPQPDSPTIEEPDYHKTSLELVRDKNKQQISKQQKFEQVYACTTFPLLLIIKIINTSNISKQLHMLIVNYYL